VFHPKFSTPRSVPELISRILEARGLSSREPPRLIPRPRCETLPAILWRMVLRVSSPFYLCFSLVFGWRPGRHRLLCGDTLVPSNLTRVCQGLADLVVADGPYGLDHLSSQPVPGRRKRKIANDEAAGIEHFPERALPVIKAQMKHGAVIHWFGEGGRPSTSLARAPVAVDRHFALLKVLCWNRVDPRLGWRSRRPWEAIIEASVDKPCIWQGGTEQRSVLRYPRAGHQAGDHPTPKAVALVEETTLKIEPSPLLDEIREGDDGFVSSMARTLRDAPSSSA